MKRFKLYWFFRKIYDKFIRDKNESIIPNGCYCYCGEICPYWDKNPFVDRQENGYCSYLGKGDWECQHLSLLWDQCKECGINDRDEDEER